MLQLVKLHPIYNNGVRVGLGLEAGLFVSFIYSRNPKFRDRVLEYSTLTQIVGAVSCRHECPVCRLLEPKVRGSDVRVLALQALQVCGSRLLVCRILGVAPRSFVL